MEAFCRDDEAATAIEYAFIAALVAVAGFATFATLGDTIETMYGVVSNGVFNSISGG